MLVETPFFLYLHHQKKDRKKNARFSSFIKKLYLCNRFEKMISNILSKVGYKAMKIAMPA
jgi:hypothetical protein